MKEMNNTIFLTDDETGEEEIRNYRCRRRMERYRLVVPVEEEGDEDEALILKDISEKMTKRCNN